MAPTDSTQTSAGGPIPPNASIIRAAADGNIADLRALINSGADVNSANQAGQTPLMMAALMGRAEIVPILLEAGADVRLEDNHGFTAMEWSKRRGFSDITQLLAAAVPPPTRSEESRNADEKQYASGERFGPQELGPATIAVLKTVHADLEAQRQIANGAKELPQESTVVAEASHKNGQGVEIANQVVPDIREEKLERGRLFAAGFRKIDEEVRVKIRQHLPTADLTSPEPVVEPSPAETPPVLPVPGPQRLETPLLATDAAASWSSPELSPSVSLEDFATGATTEPLTEPPTAPLTPEEPVPASIEEPEVQEIPVDTQREFAVEEVEEVEPETVLSAKPVEPPPAPVEVPTEPDPNRPRRSRRLFDLEEPPPVAPIPAQEPSHSVARPFLWVLVIGTLIGSVVLTYFITNRLINGETSSGPAAATTSTAPAPPAATGKSSARAPFTAGTIAGAELNLPDAEYPEQAKNEGKSGVVTVLVRVNRASGVVTSAQALNGDRELRAAAENAANAAKFSPGKLPDEAKVVAGTITYVFGSANVDQPVGTGNDSPILGGALVGTGLSIPKAPYPEQGKGAAGAVMVVVRVNRFGEVIATRPLNGDTQLRLAATKAARQAKFAREKLPKESLVTSGTITYNFKPPETVARPVAEPQQTVTPATSRANEGPVVTGDLAGKELNIPKAEYPADARSKGISGTVAILIRVNRSGRVISWRTLSGDPLLRPAALKAAKKATFSPEKLGNIESVLGTVTYTFKL